MISIDPNRTTTARESEEAFERSLAELTSQLAARPRPEPPQEFPMAPDEDSAWRPRWGFRALVYGSLAIAVGAGILAFSTHSTRTAPAAPPPAPRTTQAANYAAPPPPVATSSPTVRDFAGPGPDLANVQPAAPAPAPAAVKPDAKPLDDQGRREMQTHLQSLGFYKGPIDGVIGPLTQSAVQRYEKSKGNADAGKIDSDLLDRLRSERSR